MNKDNNCELLEMQKNIWLIEQHFPNTNINNIMGILEFKETIDCNILKKAINILVKENDALRLRIKYNNGKIEQYVDEYSEFDIDVLNIEDDVEYFKEFSRIAFDLTKDKLYHFEIIKNDNGTVKLISRFHHIITDAWALSLIISEIINIYECLKYKKNQIKENYSYLNYINSERTYMNSDRYFKDQLYWNEIYKKEPQILNLKPEIIKTAPEASRIVYKISKEQVSNIKEFCKENSITEYCLFLTCLQIYLSKKYDVNDIIIGNPFLNRKNHKEKATIGIFVNTLPIRLRVDCEETVEKLLRKNSIIIRNALKHEKYPYNDILKYVKNKHQINQSLYNVLFSYQNAKDNRKTGKIKYSTEWIFNNNITDKLQIHIHDRDDLDEYNIVYDYQKNIFNEQEIYELNDVYLNILKQIITNINKNYKEIKIISKKEEKFILKEVNNQKCDFTNEYKYKNIVNLLEHKINDNKIAIQEYEKKITYNELFIRVNKLVTYLKKNTKIKENENIGIIASKNIDTIVGLLAISKMNCTFVPIDPTYPNERKSYMIENAKISTMLYTTDLNIVSTKNVINITFNNYKNEVEDKSKYEYDLNNNLYIIYTSGSTGKPKPVTITHKNIINLIMNEIVQKDISFSDKSNILQFATLSFDVSFQEIFTSLLTHSTLHIISDSDKKDSTKLLENIIKNNIDILFISPRYLTLLAEIIANSNIDIPLKHIITAGEQLIITENIKKLIDKNIIIHNHYGPAETHVATTYSVNQKNIELKPPIGKPISNANVYILDKNQLLCPINTIGEIYISGDCVGNGYFNKKELTRKNFFEDPFNSKYKMYKTGDLGKMDKNGNIYYFGRTDFQVKVNGYRIEIEEVEKNILSIDVINNVAVLVEKDNTEKNKLLAFIELNNKIDYNELRTKLLTVLPQYMIPSKIYLISQMPLNVNGKIDKKKLEENKYKYHLFTSNNKKILPQNTEEVKILKCIQKIIRSKEITVEDDFFEVGGDSLLAIALQVELAKEGIVLNTQEIYDNPSTRKIDRYLKNKNNEEQKQHYKKIYLNASKVKIGQINNILLTGATGFLGAHILNKLLNNTKNNIYCLIRNKNNIKAKERLASIYKKYFNENIDEYLNKRVYIIEGDLIKNKFGITENQYIELQKNINLIINTAASVKHYGKRDYNFEHNVISLKNIVDFAETTNILINHISTLGIAGNNLVDTNECYKDTFNEEDLIIGQKYNDNVYVSTKLQAEQLLIENINNNNIKANIIRVGNLMNRYSDNKFQINPETNAFQNKIKEMIKLGYVPKSLKDFTFDITPVDLCADAIVKLVLYDIYNNIYHVLNDNELKIDQIKEILGELDIKLDYRDNFEKEDLRQSQWLINDFILKNKRKIRIDSTKTKKVLKDLGFQWKDDKSYYKKVLKGIVKEGEKNENIK